MRGGREKEGWRRERESGKEGEREGSVKQIHSLTQLPAGNVSIFNTPSMVTDGSPCSIEKDFDSAIVKCSTSGVRRSRAIDKSYGTVGKWIMSC